METIGGHSFSQQETMGKPDFMCRCVYVDISACICAIIYAHIITTGCMIIHAYKETNEVVGLNGWIVISCCFNHDVHPCEHVFPMSSPWIIVYININIHTERERETGYYILYVCIYIYIHIYIYMCVCACVCVRVWLYVYYIYIYTHTYAHQKPYIRTYKNVHQHGYRAQNPTIPGPNIPRKLLPSQSLAAATTADRATPPAAFGWSLENWCVWSALRHSKGPKRVDSSKVQFQNRGKYHVSIILIPFGGYYHLKKMMIWKKILDLGQFREHDLRLNWRWFRCCWGRWCGCLPASIIHVVPGQANGASFKALSAS